MKARFLPSFGTKHLKFKVDSDIGKLSFEFLITKVRGAIETSQFGSTDDEGFIIINCLTGQAHLFPKQELKPSDVQEYFGDEFEGMDEDIASSVAKILTKEVMNSKPEGVLTRG